ncbi:hypothetical protein PRZ48_012221 [Zasmidium cellare]|uniref:DUF7704 domain-containing protein n=1 Tax=Zasmidium cellare TaxID=395010 RepID=A0ABR0E4U4_ZASCE|nr:hypothetical protein PRZ48_012221 [Zasmidium cellare]
MAYHKSAKQHSQVATRELLSSAPRGTSQRVVTLARTPDDVTVTRLIWCIQRLGMESTPMAYLPSRISESKMLDMAIEAFMHLHIKTGWPAECPLYSYRKYMQTVALLRKHLDTWDGKTGLDAIVGTVNILGVVDALSRDNVRSRSQAVLDFFTHWNGLSNLLLYSSPSGASSEIAQACLDMAGGLTFAIPCFGGIPSPFETKVWLESEPTDLHTLPSELQSLKRCTRRLSIKLPGLISLVRQLRSNPGESIMCQARALSAEIYAFQDESAMDWVLSRTWTSPTEPDDETTQDMVPITLHFANIREMTAATMYWQSRILATRLYRLLHGLGDGRVSWDDMGPSSEEMELVNNIFMAFPFPKTIGSCADAPFTMGFVITWLICWTLPDFQGLPIDSLEAWILRQLDVSFAGWAIGPSKLIKNLVLHRSKSSRRTPNKTMPPKSSPVPTFYRIAFLIIDPLIAISGVYLNIFAPALTVDSFVPSSLSPYQPLQSFLLHQIAGGLLTCAILDVFLLRKTNEVWIWRTQQWAQLAYDVVILTSQVYSWVQQGRLSLGALRLEDWASFAIVAVVGLVRILFIAGIGMKRNGGKRR